MLFKNLFTVPTGQKVTEKHLRRVLVSSICGILLCMSCLAGTTWAWYTVEIENRGNEIQIATVTADVNVLDAESNAVQPDDGNYNFATGTYTVQINLESDATEAKNPVYVVISVSSGEENAYYYLTFENGNKAEQILRLQVGADPATVRFSVSWVRPVSAIAVNGEDIVIGEAPGKAVDPSTETTLPEPEPSTEASEPSTGETEPSEKETEGE